MGVPGPWWPYYDPYYYYNPPYPYAAPSPANYAAPEYQHPVPEAAAYDLKTVEEQVAKARDTVNQEYSDGDISRMQLKEADRNIDEVQKQARAEAAAGGGYLTRAQQDALLRALWTGQHDSTMALESQAAPTSPPPAAVPKMQEEGPAADEAGSGENLQIVLDQFVRLNKLLDGKLVRGDITKAQHDGEAKYLARIQKEARSQAGDGDLTPSQENALLITLLRAQESVQNNFIAN